jgi:two-component system chemotaxis sensor kinase CheA
MALDRNAFVENYLDELKENIQSVEKNILVLKKDPENPEELSHLLRMLHTIKGSSRMLKYSNIEAASHGIENVFKGIKEGRFAIDNSIVQLVFLTIDYINEAARRIKKEGSDDLDTSRLVQVLEKAYSAEHYELDKAKAFLQQELPQSEESESVKKKNEETKAAKQKDKLQGSYGTGTGVNKKIPISSGSEDASSLDTVRIKIEKVDEISKNMNSLIMRQFQLKRENETLLQLENSVRELRVRDESRSDMSSVLESLQNLRKRYHDEMIQLEHVSFNVQEKIMGLRMLPLELILGYLGKMVAEMAINLNKEIDLTITGSQVLVDKYILESIYDPIIHLVRNSVDHGIETPAVREQAGKPRSGSLSVHCSAEGGNAVIRIVDDGKGVDYEKVRKKAMKLNPHQAEEIAKMDESELNPFIFASGFSTNDKVSKLSGRGVGLDIVKYNIESLKGKITLKSKAGEGAEFILSLPLSLATTEGFFITAGGEKFFVPSNYINEIVIRKKADIVKNLQKDFIKLRSEIIPLYYLVSLLGPDRMHSNDKLFILIVETLGEKYGIIVDSIIQFSSLIYKPLPKNLTELEMLQGIVFDESFHIINILHMPELIKKFKSIKNIMLKERYSYDLNKNKRILVVDDSYSTREIERSILETEDYSVDTAMDGLDALEKMRDGTYHCVVTDIHMPKMDGITLLENMRRTEKFKTLPVIVVSSEKDEELKRKCETAGCSAFLQKADFERGNLLSEVKNCIG